MKAFITIFHKNHAYDPTLTHLFKAFEKVGNVEDCDVVIMPITYQNDYVFDDELAYSVEVSGKKIIIVDFVEYGWDVEKPYHLFGVNTQAWKNKFQNIEYEKLDFFIYRNESSIKVYFKRELVSDHSFVAPYKILPAEYPGVVSLPESNQPVTFEEYNSRPIDVMMVWGLSNPSRPLLHGEFVKQSALNGQHLVSNLDHVSICQARGDKRMVVMVHMPDFARESIFKLLHLQSLAKVSISLNGSGFKCFRHTESSYNSAMAFQENGLDWTYPWIDGINSISLPNKKNSTLVDENKAYERIMHYLNKPEQLYSMYVHGVNNWKNYEVNKYSSDYILKEIQKA
jgi:hypothetical protein